MGQSDGEVMTPGADDTDGVLLAEIIAARSVSMLYQPVVELETGRTVA